MWEWFKRQLNYINTLFVNLGQTPATTVYNRIASQIRPVNISALLGKEAHSIEELKEKALTSVEHAKKLLQRNDLKEHLNYRLLCELINVHRKNLDIHFIQTRLRINQISILDLAQYSVNNALILLKSRFLNVINAHELAEIYYQYRHDSTFISALIEKRASNIQYPDVSHIPSISYILKKAHAEGNLKLTFNIIQKSTTLIMIFSKELGFGHKSQSHTHRFQAVPLPEKDPYLVLRLARDANDDEVKRAYRKKALLVHPDKIHSVDGKRFKEVNEAYEFLMNAQKRKAWDDAHPDPQAKRAPQFHRK